MMSPQRKLRKNIESAFDLSGIMALCFDLSLPYDELPGNRLSEKINSLLVAMVQLGRLAELHELLVDERPNTQWQKLETLEAINWDMLAASVDLPPSIQTQINVSTVGQDLVGRDKAQRDILNAETINVIYTEGGREFRDLKEQPEMSGVDAGSELGSYLSYLIRQNRYLRLQGIRSGGRTVHIELDKIYITLRTLAKRKLSKEEIEQRWLSLEAGMTPGMRDAPKRSRSRWRWLSSASMKR